MSPWRENPLVYGAREGLRALWRRLPPRDARFLLQNIHTRADVERLLQSPHYQKFIERELAYWDAAHAAPASVGNVAPSDPHDGPTESTDYPEPAEPAKPAGDSTPPAPGRKVSRYVLGHALVRDRLYRQAGVPFADPWLWMQRECRRRHTTAFVPGAGAGAHCRLILDLKLAQKVVAVDISRQAIEAGRRAFAQLGYDIEYVYGDLNFLADASPDYDLCVAMHAFHHAVDLESMFGALRRSLARHAGGRLFMEEYVGPRYVEYPRPLRALANEALRRLPAYLRRADNGETIERLDFRNRWHTQKLTPFEAIRSDAIPEQYRRAFEPSDDFELGGGLVTATLERIIGNFDETDAEANAALEALLETDRELTDARKIPNFYLVTSGYPR